MKFRMILFIVVIMNFFTLLLPSQYETNTSDKAPGGNWTFEMYNKSGKKIDVFVYKAPNGSLIVHEELYPSSIGNTKFRIKNLNTKDSFYIVIKIKNLYNKQTYTISKRIKSASQREQIYLTFDDQDALRPQTGTWKGFGSQVGLGKTESGLWLNKNKNIKKTDIEKSNYEPLIEF